MYETDHIAILMATYNGSQYVEAQIQSLLRQSYTDWELYIHDDGSKDNTMSIIKSYEAAYPDRIHYIEGPGTGGAKNNFFYLMNQVDAPYVMFCDQDDVWLENKIERSFQSMKKEERRCGLDVPVLVFTDLKVVDRNLNVLSESMNRYQKLNPKKIEFKDLLIQNVVTGCTMMVNRACIDKANAFCDSKPIIMHDWWLALVAAHFGKIAYIDEALILYRQHGDNTVGAKSITDLSYIRNKIISYTQILDSLQQTRGQAKLFSSTYKQESTSLSSLYAQLGEENKLQRLCFYMRNGVWKSSLIRNIGVLIWG